VLVELLAVIVILAIILAVAIPSINNIVYGASLKSFAADEKMMVNTAKYFLGTQDSYLPTTIGETVEIKLSDLQSGNLISDIKNPWDNSDTCDGYILVTKTSTNSYDYDPYLKCDNNYKAGGYVADALDAFWKLNNNAYDYTPNSNPGNIQNVESTTNRFGTEDAALGFNGPSNFVDTTYDYSIDYNGGTTFALWVKFDTINTAGKTKNIFGKNTWEYILSQIDNKLQFTVWDSKGNYAIQLPSNSTLQIDKWYNIVIVYDGTIKKFYIYLNGALDASGTTSSTSFSNKSESLKIGRGYPDAGAAASTFFLGSVDNLYIYGRAWSAAEVKLNYDMDQIISK
jgi:type IV pilus assembly protein PilA